MQTRSVTRNTVLGKRHAPSEGSCTSETGQNYSPMTPDTSPNPKRMRRLSSVTDDGSNKENIPPFRGQVFNSPSSSRSLRRTTTEAFVASSRSTPRRHASMSNLSTTPRTPATTLSRLSLITPPPTPSALLPLTSRARALLRTTCNNATSIAGRDQEREVLKKYLQSFITQDAIKTTPDDEREPAVLYVSGSPGTGKTALVNELLRDLATEINAASIAMVTVNCMALDSIDALWTRLSAALNGSNEPITKPKCRGKAGKETAFEVVRRLLSQRRSKCIIFLDELDHIGSSAQALANLFSLVQEHSSLIRLIGIANTHTLTSSSSSTLSVQSAKHVRTLHFAPYSPEQLLAILKARLAPLYEATTSEDPKKFLPLPTLTLLTKKIAAQTGDVRALFEVLRGAIDIAVNSVSSPNPLAAPTPAVTPTHVIEALKAYAPAASTSRPVPSASNSTKAADKSCNNEVVRSIRNLGLQARLALLALQLAYDRLEHGLTLTGVTARAQPVKRTQSTPTSSTPAGIDMNQLHTYYSTLVNGGLFTAVSRSEFSDLVGMLETVGLVSIVSRLGGKLPGTPTKSSGKRGLARAQSFGASAMGGGQDVRMAESVRMEEVIRGLGLSSDMSLDDVKDEEIRSIWEKERVKISKEAKVKDLSTGAADAFADATED
ncbi:P-loop containing nucleoside triphosphate hydrolase protein [Panus rudis PR-1116 ss-1]|nr:P-loop containing nucleoside triphosphate hydrolase protein [Panus rudis PR-1116 ss-1]